LEIKRGEGRLHFSRETLPMPDYLLSARGPDQGEVAEWVQAPTADLAVEQLRQRGYTDIVLHTEEVMAAAFPRSKATEKDVTPRESVTILYFRGYLDQVNFLLRKLYQKRSLRIIERVVEIVAKRWVRRSHLKTTLLVTLGYLGYLLCRLPLRGVLELGNKIDLVILLIVLVVALGAPLVGMARAYERVVEHAMWCRWNEVLRLLPDLPPLVPGHERALREAQALAGLGQVAQGLAVFRPFRENGTIPPWFYYGRLVEFYSAAGEWGEVVAANEQAVQLAPDYPVLLINLAIAHLRISRDAGRAKELLDRAKAHPLTPLMNPYVAHAEGLLALAQGDANVARNHFESALKEAKKLVVGDPVGRFKIDLIHADLAVAFGRLGDTKQALWHYRRAGPRLQAWKWVDLLQQCEEAIGRDVRPS
jgi:tetratricopeptide (TPR) repeat protein